MVIALILGIVEGLTEFLPVSSTGHLILVGHLLSFTDDVADTFEIVIQLGAILAVVYEYRVLLFQTVAATRSSSSARRFILGIGLAFLPAAVVGLGCASWIKAHLFSPLIVAGALIVGGIVMWIVERMLPTRPPQDVAQVQLRQAFFIGCAQIFALFPGVSRSASTIIGGMITGLDRRSATEFSFFLAIPTLGAATAYDLLKNLHHLNASHLAPFTVGLVTSFVSALAVIRIFIRYVQTHDFRPFALYRIVVGVLVLIVSR